MKNYKEKAEKGTITLTELEELLTKKFVGQTVRFRYPGKKDVFGICQRISIDTRSMKDIIAFIDSKQYTFEAVSIKEHLICIKDIKDGDTGTTGTPEG